MATKKQQQQQKYQVLVSNDETLETTVYPEGEELFTKEEAIKLAKALKDDVTEPHIKISILNTTSKKITVK